MGKALGFTVLPTLLRLPHTYEAEEGYSPEWLILRQLFRKEEIGIGVSSAHVQNAEIMAPLLLSDLNSTLVKFS